MSRRGLAILVALLVLAVVYLWRVDRPTPAHPDGSETVGGLLPAELEAVAALEVDRAGETVRVERSASGAWKLVSPFEAEADPREVDALFRAAKDASIRRVVEEKGSDRAPFGLAPAAATLRVERKDGGATFALEIGRESPLGGSRYATSGDGRVLLVEGLDPGVTDRKAESLRERRLIPLAESDIWRIAVSRTQGELQLERDASGWRLTAPIQDAADTPTADALARTIAALSLARPQSRSASPSGKAEITLTVATKEGRTLHAELGPAGADGTRSARREGTATFATLEPGSATDLSKDASDFRDRRVVRAEADAIRAIRIVDSTRTIRVWRKEQGSAWSAEEEPGGTPVAASDSKVSELLDRLRWLRAERFDGPGPGHDARVVELVGADGVVGRVELDREPYDSPGDGGAAVRKLLRVRSSWRPDATLSVAAERVGALPQRAADLADAPAGSGAPPSTP